MASRLSLALLISTIATLAVLVSFDFLEVGDLFLSSFASFVGKNMLLKRFAANDDNSLSPALLRAVNDAMRPQRRKLVATCGMGGCGGLADRARGLAFVASLAIMTDRQLVLHPSIMSNRELPLNFTGAARFMFHDNCDEQVTIEKIHTLRNTSEETIYITSICYQMSLWKDSFKLDNPISSLHLAELYTECSLKLEDTYYCGAGILQQVESFQGPIAEARQIVDGLETLLPKRNYTVIQIRAGGSNIDIGNSTVKAVAWEDGYASLAPEMWIQAFRNLNYSDCQNSVAVLSDSSRVLAEIRHAARDRIMISHCCNQPLHRERTKRQEFFFQEVIDLLIMARSRRIIAGTGHFVDLGRTWLGKEGPDLMRISTMESINEPLNDVFKESLCIL